ncbi:unnamed protein product [Parajaminaea phylloscopi]
MSVLLETSVGDIVLDLDVERAPRTCENFLKLCKAYKYNYCAFFSVQKNFLAQAGDPSSTGKGGSCIWSQLPSTSAQYSSSPYFRPERSSSLKHRVKGTLSMALSRVNGRGTTTDAQSDEEERGDLVAGSQFFITLADNIDYLDGKHAPFGAVVEGQEEGEALDKINAAFTDDANRPLRDIRIKHVIVLDDPFPDPEGLELPSRTPSPTPEQLASIRLGETDEIEDERTAEEQEEQRRKADSSAAALTLEMVGDLPFAEIRPPENILFVCKLNPVTRSEDLELIFSRFGKILSCEVIRDKKSGDSLQYAFIEFDERESAEQAYFKMDSVLIDNQRIRVDFSQSVSKLHGRWVESRTGGRRTTGQSTTGSRSSQSRNATRPASRYQQSAGPGSDYSDRRGPSRPNGHRDGARTDGERYPHSRHRPPGDRGRYEHESRHPGWSDRREGGPRDRDYDHRARNERDGRDHHRERRPYELDERHGRTSVKDRRNDGRSRERSPTTRRY